MRVPFVFGGLVLPQKGRTDVWMLCRACMSNVTASTAPTLGIFGAEGGSRTLKGVSPPDFESGAFASFTTPANQIMRGRLVELRGIEPLASTMPLWRSPS